MIKKILLIIFISLITNYPCQSAYASSLSGAVEGLKVDKIRSFNELKAALVILQAGCNEAIEKNQFTFSLQKLILLKSGSCVSKITALQQKADLTPEPTEEELRFLFSTNRDVLKKILFWNRKRVEDLQETKLDQMKDTAAFFASPAWQQPQYLISLSSYWLSWNGYYSSLLYPANDTLREDLLEEAVEGFSRTFIDFKEPSIVIRSLFGRALCYKQMQKYDKAIQDITSVIGKITPDDELYVRGRYEKVLISYLTGNYESALSRLNKFQREVSSSNIPGKMQAGLKKLKIKIILALLEKEPDPNSERARKHYYDALHELQELAKGDESQAGELYRFVKEHVSIFAELPYAEMGPMGNLAIADWYFSREQYDKAIARYRHLSSLSSERLIVKRMDDVCFRLGYSFCQKEQWQEALTYFKKLFKKFPDSPFTGKSACLYYVAAAHRYKGNPTQSTYALYVEAVKNYLKLCTDPKDKSEAHFQLGKYYQDKGDSQKALAEFALVEKDSPNYIEARYYVLMSGIDKLESFSRRGMRHAKKAQKIYAQTSRQLEQYQKLVHKQQGGADKNNLTAHITIIQAKLYTYGPEETCKQALQTLADFENRFPQKGPIGQLFLTVKSLRMKCFQRLQRVDMARQEISSFLRESTMGFELWSFLNECANMFYDSSIELRSKGSIRSASDHAQLALMIYSNLCARAEKNTIYKKFYDSLQLRMAEIYRDENQLAQARKLYQENLQRNPQSADAIYNLGLISEQEGRWEEALALWRKFSEGLTAGSYHWFESRYRTANTLNQLGRKDKACEIMTMTHVLHPELRDNKFKQKFMKLKVEICKKKETQVTSNARQSANQP